MFPVVIIAGGLATRMRPLTEKIPKSMLDINGKPFIEHQLKLLSSKGVTNVILCLGFLGEQIKDFVKDGRRFNINVDYSFDGKKLLGTGGAIKNLSVKLPENFFVLYGDSYLNIDYKTVEEAYKKAGKKALMTVYKNEGKFDASNVVFKNDEIVLYSKKIKTPEMNYIDYGLGVFNKSVFDELPEDENFDLAYIYEKLSLNKELSGCEVFERFYEAGSPRGLEDLKKIL